MEGEEVYYGRALGGGRGLPHADRHEVLPEDAGFVTTPVNIAQSVRDRLMRVSKATGQDYQRIVLRYIAERLFARLAESRFRDQFILKGAMLFEVACSTAV